MVQRPRPDLRGGVRSNAHSYRNFFVYRICIDGLTYETMYLIDRERLGADVVKLIWDPEMVDRGEAAHSDVPRHDSAHGRFARRADPLRRPRGGRLRPIHGDLGVSGPPGGEPDRRGEPQARSPQAQGADRKRLERYPLKWYRTGPHPHPAALSRIPFRGRPGGGAGWCRLNG